MVLRSIFQPQIDGSRLFPITKNIVQNILCSNPLWKKNSKCVKFRTNLTHFEFFECVKFWNSRSATHFKTYFSKWIEFGTNLTHLEKNSKCVYQVHNFFLAHLSRRLKWAIAIAHRPSSVRPSVRPSSSVRRPSSVNFHIFNFFPRTAWWILMKLGRGEVLMAPYKCCCFSARSAQGRIQGGAKICHQGPLLQGTSSWDRKATATNRMHSGDLEVYGKKCCYFGSISKSNFWRVFDVFLDLVIFCEF